MAKVYTKQDAKDWIMSKVRISKKTGCWMWQGPANQSKNLSLRAKIGGEMQERLDLVSNQASRSAYALWHPNKFDSSLFVLHKDTCPKDVSGMCVNPEHMYQGTQLDNTRDRYNYGCGLSGQNHPHALITNAYARKIKKLLATGLTSGQVTKKLGYSYIDNKAEYLQMWNIVYRIAKGTTWNHI